MAANGSVELQRNTLTPTDCRPVDTGVDSGVRVLPGGAQAWVGQVLKPTAEPEQLFSDVALALIGDRQH